MSKYLLPNLSDTLGVIFFKVVLRLMVAILLLAGTYFLAFASTMGPPIANGTYVLGIELDMIVRIGVIGFAILVAIMTIIWLVLPLLYYAFKALRK